ncbi:hypothetical protein J2X69_002415 [Algoriphagus sp. 4150]|uniref:hypothetical protein n=1 Tax=Algoriphagus sp. 4150 TaxID=2817756 RepID=UPI00285F1102|nr:hypothetical protein [Algoriphagus sp. 4150]MDR7130068.1 hypothetical protein [Algoriphagus sp. 4150]
MLLYKRRKSIALFLLLTFLVPMGSTQVFALTSGPFAPEFRGFSAIGTNEMVDPFTGDFSYNIPLFELPGPNGGYPFTLSYAAGSQMDDEASWVGLGWTLSSGAINRQLRGYPDEFAGDLIHNTVSMVPSVTVGVQAGLGLEVIGFPIFKVKPTLGLGIYNNNLNGPGYSISADFGLSEVAKSPQVGANLGLNFDSNEGGTVGMGFSYGAESFQAGMNGVYNSKSGLSSLGLSANYLYTKENDSGEKESRAIGTWNNAFALTFAHPSYFPQNPFPMLHKSFSATVKVGVGVVGTYPNGYVTGYYNESGFKDDGIRVATPAYGYSNFHKVDPNSDYLIDLNREKDGMINSFSPNLAIPHHTYDLFSVSAAGIGGTFRAYRNDFGLVPESTVKSHSIGLSAGVELGGKHVGGNATPSYAENKSGFWGRGAEILEGLFFNKIAESPQIAPVDYSFVGDRNSFSQSLFDKTGGMEAVNVRIQKASGMIHLTNEKQGYTSNAMLPFGEKIKAETQREVLPLINADILKNNLSLIPELNIEYFDKNNNIVSLNRANFPEHHIAGYIITDQNGLRYIFGLPVYNLVQEEYNFSASPTDSLFTDVSATNGKPRHKIPNTKEYYKKTEIPAYAYSYLLTSIQGPDYVDVTADGVSSDDLGYWVKFSYQKITDNVTRYKWRDPYIKAHYLKGFAIDVRDDQGAFTYGEKEVYFLKQAETKTHIAKFIFNDTDRADSRGAVDRFQDAANPADGLDMKSLKEVKLFTRFAGENEPLKKVKFTYDNSLCTNLPNAVGGAGKLTLKSVAIENGVGTQGSQNPYTFTYSDFNPSYSQYSKDRWGNYKPALSDGESNIDWPYVDQRAENEGLQDRFASAWNLSSIVLPSKGTIKIDYEADRYAFVQNEQAGSMTKMELSGTERGNKLVHGFNPESTAPKIRFKLDKPIGGTLSSIDQKSEVMRYLDMETKEVFVKLDINLRKPQGNDFELIEGYLNINLNAPMTLVKDGTGNYVYGEFELAKINGVHPFAAMAWKHIEFDQPWAANMTKSFSSASSAKQRINLIKGLSGIAGSIRQTIEGFNDFCKNNNWGREINLKKSGVRLLNANNNKIGGGHRVRQITIDDGWEHDVEGIYGQVYDYTLMEDGRQISSGVSTFEPFIGGEENTLRKSKQYKEIRKLRSNANLYFEYPVNESLYPSPSVGYSEVKILSLPSAKKAGYEILHDFVVPEGSNATYGTTGMKKMEFYTARDFPVIPLETDLKKEKINIATFPNPFLKVQENDFVASQGYGIIINDMHGRLKSEEVYAQGNSGEINARPISWTRYNYRSEVGVEKRKKIGRLNSLFSTRGNNVYSLLDEQGPGDKNVFYGYQSDFIVDAREITDVAYSGGATFNADFIFIFPIPSVYPNVGRVQNKLRTIVTNKVVFQQGILESVESSNLGSKILAQHLRWDALTGATILQRVNNNFEAPIYSLTVPAYHTYNGMGPSKAKSNYSIKIPSLARYKETTDEFVFGSTRANSSLLTKGDELLLYTNSGDLRIPVAKGIYQGNINGEHVVYSTDVDLSTYNDLEAKVYRSGNRNILTPIGRAITALEKPENGSTFTSSRGGRVPAPRPIPRQIP